MKPMIAIPMSLLLLTGVTLLRAQPVPATGKQTVLILLRQPEGTLGRRLAELPASTPVPDEVRSAAQRGRRHRRGSLSRTEYTARRGTLGCLDSPEIGSRRSVRNSHPGGRTG